MAELQLNLLDSIHSKISKIAKKEDVSIDQLVVNSISNEIIRYETSHFFAERAKNFSEEEFLSVLQEIANIEPEERDKLDRE